MKKDPGRRVQEMINKRMTLKQVQDAKPTWDYERCMVQQRVWALPTALSKTFTILLPRRSRRCAQSQQTRAKARDYIRTER